MFLQEPYLIFTISALFLIALAILEAISFFTTGASMDKLIDGHESGVDGISKDIDFLQFSKDGLDIGIDGVNLFNIGKVPFVVILASLATWFSICGYSMHFIAERNSIALSNFLSVPISFAIASIGTYFTTNIIAKIVKNHESSAVNIDDLMGEIGVVVINEGSSEKPVQIKVIDKFNKEHYLMARVAVDGVVVKQNDEVILINQQNDYFVKVLPKLSVNK